MSGSRIGCVVSFLCEIGVGRKGLKETFFLSEMGIIMWGKDNKSFSSPLKKLLFSEPHSRWNRELPINGLNCVMMTRDILCKTNSTRCDNEFKDATEEVKTTMKYCSPDD